MSTERNELAKKPIWWLFFGANVFVVLACAITWIIVSKGSPVNLWYIPTLVCNIISMVLAGLFGYFEVKDFAPQIMHFQRKWLKFYIAAFSIYVASILFNVLFFLFCINPSAQEVAKNILGWQWWVYLMVTVGLTLVAIGFQRYARFRIDLDIYRRKHGENPNKEPSKSEEKVDVKKPVNDVKKADNKKDKKTGATGGLLDQM